MKISKTIQYIGGGIAVVLFFLFQNGGDVFQGSGEKGKIITIETYKELRKKTSSDGKRIALIGRASVSNANITRRIGAPLNLIFSAPDGTFIEHLPFHFGKEDKNSCYLPNSFTPQDLVLYDNEGVLHKYDENVMVSFTLERITNAIPEKNPKTNEYVWRFKQLRIDPIEHDE
ncbi:hypothetical protein ACFSTE_04340 [Aquimarina hainanensis]|uniref:DUF4369 domain-containing protein n=1 Tax=Aquimarina hainanensis TaxID=1578017 RepID=A0ABW5N4M0_9FLAO|nr:hypothetical protein [Aquimarina sp. TRL1]QKX06066.1 hypothetical protein HN014_14500 [Aquimarina sp. TRL1]